MKSILKTYQFLTLFTAAVVAVSICLPTVLLAATHCDMDGHQSPMHAMPGEHCSKMDTHSTHDSTNSNQDNCDWNLNCNCDFKQSLIKAETVPTITKTTKVFAVSVTQFINPERSVSATFSTETKFNFPTKTPPLFLLNGVFLN